MKPDYSPLKLLKIASCSLLLLLSAQFTARAQTSWQIGNGTASNSSTGYPCPYGQWYSGMRTQFLYTAAEMTAAGMTAGSIDQMAFNVISLNNMQAMQSVTMSIKGTTTPNANSWQTGLTQVYSNPSLLPTVGWNTYTLSTPFNWNGTDNILVEVCFWNGQYNYTYNASTQWTTNAVAGVNTSIWYRGDTGGPFCTTTNTTSTSTTRPNIKFTRLLGAPDPLLADPTTACSGSPVTLTAGGLANGATVNWSGPGIPANTTTPEVGGSASYTFNAPVVAATTVNTYSASQTVGATTSQPATVDVTVEPTPVFANNSPNSNTPVCEEGTLTLSAQVSPASSYSWTGPGLGNPATTATVNINNVPTTASGTYTVVATSQAGCTATATTNALVNPKPNATLAALAPVCSSDSIFALTGGSPAGGMYTGTGVTNNTFNPELGTQTVSYIYIDGNGCSDTASQVQTVSPSPQAIVADFPNLCSNSIPYTLYGGVPQGGVFSGPGVVNGVFTQTGAGTYPITYTYTNPIGCAGMVTLDLTVNSAENSALAGTGNTVESQFITDVPAITEVRYEPDCDLMATLDPSGPTPISGNTTVKVVLDDAVNTYGGKPYLQRHYSILSVSNPVNATGTVTLYAYQSEFNAYNAVASGMGLPLLPTGVDNGNIRVTVFRNLTTTPDPTVPAVTVAPTATWDAAHSWWKLSLPVTQLGGFYIHTGDLPLDVSHMSSTAGGSLAVYPNPAKDKVNVSVSGTMKGNAQLYVSDLTGRVLIQVPMDNDKAVVDMSSLAAGMYMVTYSDDERKETLKITKQ